MDAGEVLVSGLGPGGGPFDVTFRRAVGEDEPARGVGAVLVDDRDGIDDVVLGFRHFGGGDDFDLGAIFEEPLAVAQVDVFRVVIDRAAIGALGPIDRVRDHALGEERVERLDRFLGQVAGGVHGAGEEAAIKQVQDRVFDTADILIDVHPILGLGLRGRRVGMGRGEAGEIPA